MAWVGDPYPSARVEFEAHRAGAYSVIFYSPAQAQFSFDYRIRRLGGETILLGETHAAYDDQRATRRRLYFGGVAGKTLTVTTETNGVGVSILLYQGNRPRPEPWWWNPDEAPLLTEMPAANNQRIGHTFTADGPYTIEFLGYAADGVAVGQPLSYSVSIQ